MTAEPLSAENIFHCKQCGQCCNGFGGTYVTRQDILNISAFIHKDLETFTDVWYVPSGSKFVLAQQKNGFCIFFDPDRQCTIHPVKPFMCRAWPFIKAVVRFPENWNAMADSCPGMKKNIPDKDLIRIVSNEIIS